MIFALVHFAVCCISLNVFFANMYLPRSYFRIFMHSEHYIAYMIYMLQAFVPDGLGLDEPIKNLIIDARNSFHTSASATVDVDPTGVSKSSLENVDTAVTTGSMETTHADHHPNTMNSIMFYWNLFMMSLLGVFLITSISSLAQYYQHTVDVEACEKIKQAIHQQSSNKAITPHAAPKIERKYPHD